MKNCIIILALQMDEALYQGGDSDVPVPPEPFHLGRQVPVQDIALFVLEGPWGHDQDIPFPYPDSLLDLSLDPAHARHPVVAPDTDMVCPHHQLCRGELLAIPFLWQPNTDDRKTLGIYCVWIDSIIFLLWISRNSISSVGIE
jgi:hypothetical protein